MLESDFTPPEKDVSIKETSKRTRILKQFFDKVDPFCDSFFVSGSMGYGQNYSVTAKSDLDMQILVTKETASKLLGLAFFNNKEFERLLVGYLKDVYQQFSYVFEIESVPMECHFWDKQAMLDAIMMKTEVTKRNKSNDKPSMDYGYTFDRDEDPRDYKSTKQGGFFIADFPGFRKIGSKTYFCRPITNIIGNPLILKQSAEFKDAVNECWNIVIDAFAVHKKTLKTRFINILPGKNKIDPQIITKIEAKVS